MADKFRVVAVDDDKDVLELIEMTLGSDYEVVTVRDAAEACEILDITEPDAVIVDIMMPRVTGYRIVEHLKQNARLQNCVVIFLSAKDTPRDIKYGYKVGANLYLTKPFQPERLTRALKTLLSEGACRPRRKSLTMRDIQLRLKYRLGLQAPAAGAPGGAQGSGASAGTVSPALNAPPEPPPGFPVPAPPDEIDPADRNWVG